MKPKKPKHSISVGCRTWNGDSAREVRDRMLSELGDMLNWHNFTPAVLFLPDEGVVVCSMNPEGTWYYEFIRPETGHGDYPPGCPHSGGSCGAYKSREDCVLHARRHLAQMAYDSSGKVESCRWIDPYDPEGLSQHITWCDWQDRFAAARRAGMTDEQARAHADGR